VRFMEWQEGKAILEDLGLKVKIGGTGRRVWTQSPHPGEVLEPKAEVTLMLLDEGKRFFRIPDVRGLSLREATRVLSDSLLASEIHGSGVVVRQDPVPGTEALAGTVCYLGCEE